MTEKIKKKAKGKTLTENDLQYLAKDYFEDLLKNSPLTFTITREDFKLNKEILSVDTVRADNGDPLPPEDFQLSIQSLNAPDCYWLDSGIFDINIGKQ